MKKMVLFFLLFSAFRSKAQAFEFYAGFEYKSIYLNSKPVSLQFDSIERYLGLFRIDIEKKMLIVPGNEHGDTVIAKEVVKDNDRYIFKMDRDKSTVQSWQQYVVKLNEKGEPVYVQYGEGFKGNGRDSSFDTYGGDLRYVSFRLSSPYYRTSVRNPDVWEDHTAYMHDGIMEWITGKGKKAETENLKVKDAWVIHEAGTDGIEVACTGDDGTGYTFRYLYTEKRYVDYQMGRARYIHVNKKKDGAVLWDAMLY